MCELLGVNSVDKVYMTEILKEFYSHSERHPHGWGMAVFYDNAVSLEKEPVRAIDSDYLKQRLTSHIEIRNMIAHIRYASRGGIEYVNCHPFVHRDNYGRTWTLAHNGTVFECEKLEHYREEQEGSTDSERILFHIVQIVNEEQEKLKRALTSEERFKVLDEIICDIADKNKINLMIWDGELFYVHMNKEGTMVKLEREGSAVFATVPLTDDEWKPVELTTLMAYKDGKKVFEGTNHGKEYFLVPGDVTDGIPKK